MSFFIKGFLIGLIFGIPVGAVGALTLQRTLSFGVFAGLFTGLGSSIADTIYACISVFGITIISDFLINNRLFINIVGAGILLFMGIKMITNNEIKAMDKLHDENNYSAMFLSSLAVGATNPAAILSFVFAFSYFGVVGKANLECGTALVLGVFSGTYLWWIILSCAAAKFKNKLDDKRLRVINIIFGVIIIILALAVIVRIFAIKEGSQ